MRTLAEVIHRVRAEFLEMPGMRLRPDQVQRLCGIEKMTCQAVLDALVGEQFLYARPDGHYARHTLDRAPGPTRTGFRPGTPERKAS